jgi:hypothetical protein
MKHVEDEWKQRLRVLLQTAAPLSEETDGGAVAAAAPARLLLDVLRRPFVGAAENEQPTRMRF